MSAIDILSFDESKIVLKQPFTKTKVGSVIFVGYGTGEKNYFPNLILPNVKVVGVKESAENQPDQGFKMHLSFDGIENKDARAQKLAALKEKLRKIDEKMIDLLLEAAEVPGNKLVFKDLKGNREKMREKYRGLLWSPEDDVSKQFFTMKLMRSKDKDKNVISGFRKLKDTPFIVDKSNQDLMVDETNVKEHITRGSIIKPVMQAQFLFILGKDQTISSTWSLQHARLQYKATRENFRLPEDNEGLEGLDIEQLRIDDLKAAAQSAIARDTMSSKPQQLLSDDDYDPEEEDVEVAAH